MVKSFGKCKADQRSGHKHGSTHTHTLAQNNLCEFWCGMHPTCKNTPVIPDRKRLMNRSEKDHEESISLDHRPQYMDGPPAFVNWKKSFTSIQMVHTHAPLPRGFLRPRRVRWRYIWKENGHEMTMKMRWQLLNWNTRGGTQKGKRKRENTNTNTPSPKRANPERAREKKKRTDDGPNTNQSRGGRTEAPDTTYKARAKTYRGTCRAQTWPRKGARMR